MPAKRKPPRAQVWAPVDYDLPLISAVQALYRGEASPDQQTRAIEWILHKASDTYGAVNGNAYRDENEGGPRAEAFLLGRRFVGETIVKIVNMPREIKEAMRKADGRRND